MKFEMEILSPSSYFSISNRLVEESKSARWTPAENKMFENALAVYDKDAPDRWHKVAEMIPGKTVRDVMKQYEELELDVGQIEAGLIPIPGYSPSPFTLEWVNRHGGYDGFKQQSYGIGGKRSSSNRPSDHERKKGVPWTEEEHKLFLMGLKKYGKRSSSNRPLDHERKKGVPWTEEEHKLFLMGLKKYGKGDWRNISRNFVVTRTPTQVASHAQKYFIRQLSGGKDKRRASIHDITTVNLNDMRTPSPDNKGPLSPELPQHPNSAATARAPFQWHQPQGGGLNLGFNQGHGNMFMSSHPYGISSYGQKMQGQDLHKGPANNLYYGPQNLGFQMQSSQHYPHG